MRRKKLIKKDTGWKREFIRKRQERLKEVLVSGIAAILFLALLFLGFFVWQYFKKSVWDGKHQLNFVIQASEVLVYSFHPKDQLLYILTISNKTHIPTAKDYGEYQIGNIYKLGEAEKIGGGRLLSQSLQEFLGIPIDGHIVKIKDQKSKIKNNLLERSKLLPLYYCLLTKKCATNFTVKDLINIFIKINQLKAGQIENIDFTASGLVKEETLVDQSIVLEADYQTIDKLSLKYFSDQEAMAESLTVSVFNGTLKAGLADQTGRLVNNLGAELVNSANTQSEVKKSTIYYQNDKLPNSYTLKRLAKVLKINNLRKDEQIGSDLKIILGEDFIDQF